MDNKNNIILIAIAILAIALIAVGIFAFTSNSEQVSVNDNVTVQNTTNNTTTKVIMLDKDGNVTNKTVVGDNSTRNDTNTSNVTYRVYNPQSDSYVTVIGEGYDVEVDRWYTYDTDGVRYYNTRIKNH
jgi:flagellar basal body-associated protein FliL